MINTAIIHWPAFTKVHNDAVLSYIDNEQLWRSHALNEFYQAGDTLIDSSGNAFLINDLSEDINQEQLVAFQCALDIAIVYVQAHASAEGHCCISKFGANNFPELMTVLDSLS